MKRLLLPVLWIGLGIVIGVGAVLTSAPLLARQLQEPTSSPTFLLKIVAPGGATMPMTSVECVSGCTFKEAKVLTDGTKRTFQTPSFQSGCKNDTCEWTAGGVITR